MNEGDHRNVEANKPKRKFSSSGSYKNVEYFRLMTSRHNPAKFTIPLPPPPIATFVLFFLFSFSLLPFCADIYSVYPWYFSGPYSVVFCLTFRRPCFQLFAETGYLRPSQVNFTRQQCQRGGTSAWFIRPQWHRHFFSWELRYNESSTNKHILSALTPAGERLWTSSSRSAVSIVIGPH